MVANIVNDVAALGVAANKKRIMAGDLPAALQRAGATLYDPSAFKSFTVGAAGSFIGNVRTYVAPNHALARSHGRLVARHQADQLALDASRGCDCGEVNPNSSVSFPPSRK
jgi:hypothetical protein